jgi:clan AA aspartic protease (TIGR02281 family)
MGRLARMLWIFAACVSLCSAADLDTLYLTSQWFRLRDAVAADPKAPDFYKGAAAAAFNDRASAERYLNAAMKSGADPAQRVEAGLLLVEYYANTGRRKAAAAQLQQIDSMLRGLAGSKAVDRAAYRNFQQLRAELSAMNVYRDQVVVSRRLSRVPYFQIDNQIVLPVSIDGKAANFFMDTGASESVIDEEEAQRLGLEVHPASIPLEPYGAHSDLTATGVAMVRDLIIGNVHLRDVAFLVVKDQGYDGLLGLPVLLALETLRWGSDGMMEIGFPPQARRAEDANLCLDAGSLVTEAAFGNAKLNLFVDTGTYETLLFPTFSHEFPSAVAGGVAEPFTVSDTNHDPEARTLSTLTLRLGGADVTAGRVHALSRNFTEDGSWAHGNMGMDFAGGARSVTLDFAAMRIGIEGGPRAGGSAEACTLPAGFLCLSGFACTVRYDPGARCHVDRVPVDAPAGNPLPSPEYLDAATSCRLPANFACGRAETCTAVFDGKGGCRVDGTRAETPDARTVPAPGAPEAAASTLPAAGADARELMERSLKFESLEMAPAKDYVFTQESVTKNLDADGKVKSTSSETHEVMTLYDQRYERLTHKDGKPLPAGKERSEQARFDKAVDKRAHETPEAKAKREEAERKDASHNLACDKEFLRIFTFRLDGVGEVAGRPVSIVDVSPIPGITSPVCDEIKTLTKMHLKIWVDQAEYRWAQVQADNIGTVTWGKVLVRIPAGALHMKFMQTRLKDGVWMAQSMNARVDVRLMMVARLHVEMIETYSNYRKFQSDSRIVPLDR